jgi:hypothetical protein
LEDFALNWTTLKVWHIQASGIMVILSVVPYTIVVSWVNPLQAASISSWLYQYVDNISKKIKYLIYPYRIEYTEAPIDISTSDIFNWLQEHLPKKDMLFCYDDRMYSIRYYNGEGRDRYIDQYNELGFESEDDMVLFKLTFAEFR